MQPRARAWGQMLSSSNRAGWRKKSYGGPQVSLKCESVIADRLFHEPVAFRCGTGLGSPESLLRFVAGA